MLSVWNFPRASGGVYVRIGPSRDSPSEQSRAPIARPRGDTPAQQERLSITAPRGCESAQSYVFHKLAIQSGGDHGGPRSIGEPQSHAPLPWAAASDICRAISRSR
jgi:hypothetical protein